VILKFRDFFKLDVVTTRYGKLSKI